MKLNKKIIKLLSCGMILSMLITSCKKGLDFVNTAAISPDNVWTDANMIKSFLNDIYGASMPGWPINGGSTDEGISTAKSLGNYQRGIVTVDNTTSSLNYSVIDKVNFFLDNMEAVPTSVLSADLSKQYA